AGSTFTKEVDAPVGLELIVRVVVLAAALVFLWWAFERRRSMAIAGAIVALVLLGLAFFRVEQLEPIKLPADDLFVAPWGQRITNSELATWMTMAILLVASWRATRTMQLVPRGLQNVMEAIVEALHDLVQNVTGSADKANAFFPLVATLFLFILTANWL